MIAKKHHHGKRLVLAVCDKDLLGKKFESDTMLLDLSSAFYKGEAIETAELKELCKKAYIINAVGEKSTKMLVEIKLASPKEIKKVNDIPHIQLLIEA